MKKTLFKNVAHLYIGCKIHNDEDCVLFSITGDEPKVSLWNDKLGKGIAFPFSDFPDSLKPILKPIHLLTQYDFSEICKVILGTNDIISASIDGFWAVAESDYTSDAEGESVSNSDRIIAMEEADFDNVLSIQIPTEKNHSLELAYGTSSDMRYFVGIEIQALFVSELLKRKYDLFNLIDNGYAEAENIPEPNIQDSDFEIKQGMKFRGKYYKGLTTVISFDETANLLKVEIDPETLGRNSWTEDGWNLQHIKGGFERGDYSMEPITQKQQ